MLAITLKLRKFACTALIAVSANYAVAMANSSHLTLSTNVSVVSRPLPPTNVAVVSRPLPPTNVAVVSRPLPPTNVSVVSRPLPPTNVVA